MGGLVFQQTPVRSTERSWNEVHQSDPKARATQPRPRPPRGLPCDVDGKDKDVLNVQAFFGPLFFLGVGEILPLETW